jgi:hypothetical protein
MKRFFLVAGVCLGLFAFTEINSSRNQVIASGTYSYLLNDTTSKPFKDTTKPKPDTTKPGIIIALQGR